MLTRKTAFTKKQTNWMGLWYSPERHNYSSACLDLSILKDFKGPVRLCVVKNRYHVKGGDTPEYVFSVMDANDERVVPVEVRDVLPKPAQNTSEEA